MARPKKIDTATVDKTVAVNTVDIKSEEKEEIRELENSDEIRVISLIPNVSYLDSHSGDYYEWDETGHEEIMTFETLKNMWRTSKGYFRNLWLKPLDSRVIKKFSLEKVFDKYESLMNVDSYNRKNIDSIIKDIDSVSPSLKFSIFNFLKENVIAGNISDTVVLRKLERKFDFELIDLIETE